MSVNAQLKKRTTSTPIPVPQKNVLANRNGGKKGNVWRFGFVKSQEIIQVMPEFEKARTEIQALKNQYESDLKSMQEELQKKSETYEKEQATLPANIKQRRETELQEMYQKIQQSYQDNQQALAKEQQDKMQAITTKVVEAIKMDGVEKGLLYVFENASGIIINKQANRDLTENIKYRLGLKHTNVSASLSKECDMIGLLKSSEIMSLLNISSNSDSIAIQKAIAKVVNAAEKIASHYGLAFILDNQSGVPFINDSYVCDVTTLIENELNLTNEVPVVPNKHINTAQFGHVNSQEVIQAMPEFAKARADIEALTKQYEADLKSMQDELQKKGEAFEKEQATLPENIKQRRQTELNEMYQKIQQSYQDRQQALAKEQQDKMQAITSKVIKAIEQVGKTGNYVLVMDIASGIPYISTTLSTDVTAQVKTKLGLK